MGRVVAVSVDVERLRENLSREDQRPATDADAYALLFESGFRRFGGQWFGPEEALSVLRPEEVKAMEPAAEPDLPHVLSREYEDHLDWLENQRRTRARAGPRRSLLDAIAGAMSVLSKARALLRRR